MKWSQEHMRPTVRKEQSCETNLDRSSLGALTVETAAIRKISENPYCDLADRKLIESLVTYRWWMIQTATKILALKDSHESDAKVFRRAITILDCSSGSYPYLSARSP